MYMYFVPLFAQQFGATYLELGYIGTATALTYAVAPLIVGHFADRLSRIRLYAIALLINAVATVVLVFSRSVSDIVLLRAFGGVGFAFLWPTAEVLVVDLGPKEDRVKEMGTYSVAWGSGFLIGPAVGGLLVRTLGFINLFLISFLLILVGFLQAILGVVPYAKPLRKSASEKIDVMRQLLPWYVLIACYGMIFSIVTTILPGYANSVGITAELIGILFAIFGISRIAVFATIQHYLSFGEARALSLVSLLISGSMLMLALSPSFFAFLPAMIVLGTSFAIIFPISISLISRNFPPERAGAAIGSYESVYGVGAAIGPVFAGAVAAVSTVGESFLVVMLFGLLMAAVAARATP
jgi:DHA1 family tetracycline resistance protein-like MFS transporter